MSFFLINFVQKIFNFIFNTLIGVTRAQSLTICRIRTVTSRRLMTSLAWNMHISTVSYLQMQMSFCSVLRRIRPYGRK